MDRGYYKTWRKEQDSAIWNKPPLYLKAWHWMRSEATEAGNATERELPPGAFKTTYEDMANALAYETPRRGVVDPSSATLSAILNFLREEGMIKTTPSRGKSSRSPKSLRGRQGKTTTITILNWDIYNQHAEEEAVETELPADDLFSAASKKAKPKKKRKKKEDYVPSPQSVRCLKAWAKYRKLPTDGKGERTATDEYYCEIFDKMARLDHIPWDDVDGRPGIFSICKHAVQVWTALYIQSPTKLRNPSREYRDQKTHQVIATHITEKKSMPGDTPYKRPGGFRSRLHKEKDDGGERRADGA